MKKIIRCFLILIFCSTVLSGVELSTPDFSFLGASKEILSLNQKKLFNGRIGNVIDLGKAKEYVVITHNSSMPQQLYFEYKLKILLQNGNFMEGIPKKFEAFPNPSVLLIKLENDYAMLEFFRDYTIIHYDGHFGFVAMDQELTIK